MVDPRATPLPEWANYPPVGWNHRTPWLLRLKAWQQRPRKEKLNAPQPRLMADPMPVSLGVWDTEELVWSHGRCVLNERSTVNHWLDAGFWSIEARRCLGDYLPKPVRVVNVEQWINERLQRANAQAQQILLLADARASEIRSALIRKVPVVDRLAAVANQIED